MKPTLLHVGAVVRDADHVDEAPTYIVMENGRIREIGSGRYPRSTEDMDVYERPTSVAIPGLINCHGHAAMTLLRGAGDDMPLMRWLHDRIFPLEAKLTADAVYWGTLLACWEMIASGTTCFTDMYFFMDDAARAVAEAGIRGVLSVGLVGLQEEAGRQGLARTRQFARTWHGAADGRIRVTLGPHAPYTCPPRYLEQVAELSAELDLPIQIHLSETAGEVEDCVREHGRSPIALMRDLGLFARPVLAAHCVHLSEDDIAILAQHNVHVAHNPQSNLKLGSGIAPVPRLLRAGITVGLGTDGAASNNNLDMFEEMRLAATLHKGVGLDATAVTASEALAMATSEGAKAVFLEPGHGRLQVGAPADIVLLDLDSPVLLPIHNLISNIVYSASAAQVTDVFVGGRALMSRGELTTLDTERIRFEVRRLVKQLRAPAPV